MPNLIVSRHMEILLNKSKTLTKGGVAGFLVNLGKRIYGNSNAQQAVLTEPLVWQRGVVFYNQSHQSTACLQVDYHKRTLKLWVQGSEAREYLVILRDEIHSILNVIKGLTVKENVLLPKFARINTERLRFEELEIEKAPYSRLLQEALLGQEVTVSDVGNQYDLKKVMGFIMTEEQQEKEGMNVTYNINTVGALGGVGNNHTVSGQVILNASDKQLVGEFQESISILMALFHKNVVYT